LITAHVLIPARMAREASGILMERRVARGESPRASADSRREEGMASIPAAVFRAIGRRP
jgi:hypothetical protein